MPRDIIIASAMRPYRVHSIRFASFLRKIFPSQTLSFFFKVLSRIFVADIIIGVHEYIYNYIYNENI